MSQPDLHEFGAATAGKYDIPGAAVAVWIDGPGSGRVCSGEYHLHHGRP